MSPLDILKAEGSFLPTPTNFRAVQDPQRRNFFYYRSFCFRPIVRNTSLAGYFPVDRRQFFKQESGDMSMGLSVFHPLCNG